MLSGLHIKNIALIDRADIEFGEGLNVLSGETGSGKSVILDCINFVLGSKADRNMIRSGENEAQVTAEFEVEEGSYAAEKLREFDIDCEDGGIIISRKYSQDGKGSIKVNGNAVTAAMLKAVTMHLVDVHGQSEHFFLLDEKNQLKVIDDLCRDESAPVMGRLSALVGEKREIRRKVKEIGGDEAQREREIDLLSFQMEELEKANLSEGELDELLEKRHIFNNAENIATSIGEAKAAIDDDGGCTESLSLAIKKIASITRFSKLYEELLDRLETISSELDDVASLVSELYDGLDFDADEAERVDERISFIRSILRKYGSTEEAAIKYLEDGKKRLDLLLSSDMLMQRYTKRLAELDDAIYAACRELTDIRKRYAEDFCGRVEGELKSLNIPDARVEVAFEQYDEKSAELLSENGSDKVSFMFSANKGEPLKPLSKVISGGEMSRFMLAVKTQIKTDPKDISTYIFDEIDAGISGRTANTMAEKFIEIGKRTQILCVSHLPQVSAASDSQYLIYKEGAEGKTVTRLKRLSDEEKIDEIVRLTGSIDSKAARDHAKELVEEFRH
ncbi:MAG: DNA repair protein RecN [Clostridia bacterium]|nr:DNA repair protein RecN [Clostridia bacterium]